MKISRRRLLQLLPFAPLAAKALASSGPRSNLVKTLPVQFARATEKTVTVKVVDEVWESDDIYDVNGFVVSRVYYAKPRAQLTNLVSSAVPTPLVLGNPAPASPERR